MIDLLTITNDPDLAAQCDSLPGMRVFVDLERNGKAERQAGRNTFISSHQLQDIARVRAVVKRSQLMVRVNPFDERNPQACREEVDAVIDHGADLLMLPMFGTAAQLHSFAAIVDGRLPLVPLLETAGALQSLESWLDTPGIFEVFMGLNDLHLSLGCRFMFEPLLMGHVDHVAAAVARRGLRFGFGGIARLEEGLLPGRAVLAEHLRLGSRAVILSRTFNRPDPQSSFTQAVADLRRAEADLTDRSPETVEADRLRVARLIGELAEKSEKPALAS